MFHCLDCFKKDSQLKKPLYNNFYCIYCSKSFKNKKELKKHKCHFKAKK